MALNTVSQPLPEMEHLLLTKQLIFILLFFLYVYYVAVGCFLAEVRHQTWFGVEKCLKNSSKSQSRLSRLGGAVVCTGSWGCRACLPKEYPFFGKGYETKVRK